MSNTDNNPPSIPKKLRHAYQRVMALGLTAPELREAVSEALLAQTGAQIDQVHDDKLRLEATKAEHGNTRDRKLAKTLNHAIHDISAEKDHLSIRARFNQYRLQTFGEHVPGGIQVHPENGMAPVEIATEFADKTYVPGMGGKLIGGTMRDLSGKQLAELVSLLPGAQEMKLEAAGFGGDPSAHYVPPKERGIAPKSPQK